MFTAEAIFTLIYFVSVTNLNYLLNIGTILRKATKCRMALCLGGHYCYVKLL